ncbi:MAG TPA: hypothetical protein VNS63_02080 [Blastocatellia bacterium]|nr:hypothetical protein [Blastocatellia bacterium]
MAATAPSKQSGQIGTSDKSHARDKVAAFTGGYVIPTDAFLSGSIRDFAENGFVR